MADPPIKVCFPFIGDEIGGSHISAIRLIEGLDPAQIAPFVVLHMGDGPLAAYLSERSIPFLLTPVSAPPARNGFASRLAKAGQFGLFLARSAVPLARFLRANETDLVHTNDGRIHLAWALPARLAGAKQVWHHRGDPDAFGVNRVAPFAAGHIVTVSRFARPGKPVLDVGRKLSVVHSPFDKPGEVDRQQARELLIRTLGCSADTRFLGYFGLLIDRKRPLMFVEAVAAYVREHPEMPVMGLMFGAPGAEQPHFDEVVRQKAAELGVADNIHLMGFRHPVETWMRAVDILLAPAVREPFGRTLIEAMFLGTPVVATADGGNLEAIRPGVTGHLVEPDDPQKFVAPVHRLLTDERHRLDLIEAAQAEVCARYSSEQHVSRLTAIYRSLMRDGNEPAASPSKVARRNACD